MSASFHPDAAAHLVRTFLAQHPAIVLHEQGEALLRLEEGEEGGYALSSENGKLVLHAWSTERSLVRRIVGCELRSGRLHLECMRFGLAHPVVVILEPAGLLAPLTRSRSEFRQAVVALLQREWPQWKSQPGWSRNGASPVQRFVLHRGQQQIVCAAVSQDEAAPTVESVLAQALLLADDAARRFPQKVLQAVRLILPPGAHTTLRLRLTALRSSPPVEVYLLDRSASRLSVPDAVDSGNLESRLPRAPDARAELPPPALHLLQEVQAHCPAARLERNAEGLLVFRLFGLEFAREAPLAGRVASLFQFGIGREQSPLDAGSRPLFHALLQQLNDQRRPDGDPRDPLYSLRPEAWMEAVLRERPDRIDAAIDRSAIYAQTPIFRSGLRDVVDLLAARRDGRLLVCELKADEDLDLPLQGIDYWLRVRYHQQRGDLARMGYFPGIALSEAAPHLLLVAPALRRHPRMDALLGWLSPHISCSCLGINEQWRQDLQVVDHRILSLAAAATFRA
jgi:hypothetical protein